MIVKIFNDFVVVLNKKKTFVLWQNKNSFGLKNSLEFFFGPENTKF